MSKQTHTKESNQNALQILAADHQLVNQIFSQFEKMKESADEDERRALVKHACEELTIHAQVEEEIFYPAMRHAIDASEALDEAEVEHAAISELIRDLDFMEPHDKLYDAKFKVLSEFVRHHINEEENEIFPLARQSTVDLNALGQKITNRKQYLAEIFGVAAMEEKHVKRRPASDAHMRPSSPRKSH